MIVLQTQIEKEKQECVRLLLEKNITIDSLFARSIK